MNSNIQKKNNNILSFNEKKIIVEEYIKIKQERSNLNFQNENIIQNKKDEKKEDKKEKEVKQEEKKEKKEDKKEKKKDKKEEKKGDKKEKKGDKKEKKEKKEDKKDSGFDIIDENEVNIIKNYESQDEDIENNEKNKDDDMDTENINLDGPLSKSDVNCKRTKINLWEVIVISNTIKKNTKNTIMKSLVSNIVYNGITFKDKLNGSTSKKSIIIYDKFEENFSPKLLKKIQDSFIYMSYRTGLVKTTFLPDSKNNYTSDCGWGCMLRCSQMMLSRGFILKRISDIKKLNKDGEVDIENIRRSIILLFYDKFLEPEKIGMNQQLSDIYLKLLKDKIEVAELIPPYSIYILTLLGKCPNVFTSDHKMISSFLKINKTLFNEVIKMIHIKDGFIYKSKLFKKFCKKIESEKEISDNAIDKDNYIEYKSQKYLFEKGGLIFISLRLGLHKIEETYIKMLPKLFNNLHNNIGFVSGKKKRAFYFIGMYGDKLIFADPHLNQKVEQDEINFPSYSVNDLFLMSVKELSSEITIGVGIFTKQDFEQFFLDIKWFDQICPGFIRYQE